MYLKKKIQYIILSLWLAFPLLGNTTIIDNLTNKLGTTDVTRSIEKSIIQYSFNGTTFLKLSPEGVLLKTQKFAKVDNYEVINKTPYKVKIEYDNQLYTEWVDLVKTHEGKLIYRPAFVVNEKRSAEVVNALHERSGHTAPYKTSTEVEDVVINKGASFYIVEYEVQPAPGAFGSKEKITTLEELRTKLAVLEAWKPIKEGNPLVVKEYTALQPIKARSGIVGPQDNLPGGAHQYEFLDNWHSKNHTEYMELVEVTKLTDINKVRYIARTGEELKKYLDELVDIPAGVTYNGKIYRSISKNAVENYGAVPNEISDFSIDKAWGRYDLQGEGALYCSAKLNGNKTEIMYYANKFGQKWEDYLTYEYNNINIPNMLDLTNDAVRQKLGVDETMLKRIDELPNEVDEKSYNYLFTNILGSWSREKYNGLIVPGTRGGNYKNIVLFKQDIVNNNLGINIPQPLEK